MNRSKSSSNWMADRGLQPWHIAVFAAAILALGVAAFTAIGAAATDPMNTAVPGDKSQDVAGLDPNSEAYIKEMEK